MRLIDADALYDDVMERYCKDCEKRKGMKRGKWRVIYEIGEAPCRACDVDDLKMELDEAPTIEAEPVRQGHWIKVGCSHYGVSTYECSVCHYTDEHNESREVPYCWQCGARMENDDNM